jgi:sugar phosphate isomerase/epimerase
MKRIVLRNNVDFKEITKLHQKYNIGVNIENFNNPYYLEDNPNAISETLEKYKNIGIYSIHGPFMDLCFGSIDKLIREVAEKRFEYAYEVSCKLFCKNIVVHNGYNPGTLYCPKDWVERSKIFWENFLLNKNKDTIFYLENTFEKEPEIITDLIDNVNKNNLQMCLDVGHANIYSKIEITDWIKKANKNIGFVHLHNNFGEKDEHNGLNNGSINMSEVCKALEQYSPNAIWEIETEEWKESIEWLLENRYIR